MRFPLNREEKKFSISFPTIFIPVIFCLPIQCNLFGEMNYRRMNNRFSIFSINGNSIVKLDFLCLENIYITNLITI